MTEYIRLLILLLENSEIVTLEYWSEFILGIQRDEFNRHPALQERFGNLRIPSLFHLRLRGMWWVGKLEEWHLQVQGFPMKGSDPISPEAPLQASVLMTILGNRISAARVNEQSDLLLNLTDGRSITVQGIGGKWEENWFLELPVDDPARDKWSIVCDSQGTIGGTFPAPTNA
jgi:hypothetical protein